MRIYLPPSELPLPLRILAGLYLLLGIIGFLAAMFLWSTTGDIRWTRVLSGLATTYAAWGNSSEETAAV